ncbi:hypothetical protein [Halegenticoccus tardaugens]|uniref:hypothetical protein n=1 Tax=Halegenticoccus tardaugens TaxID=2071624 RepID=UPI00100A7784|nr:hypothetical protein [Halegenticoccus tardaugens]
MVGSRLATALVGVALSLLVSYLAWAYFDTLALFLFVPFVPFLFRSRASPRPVKRCPACGYSTSNPEFTHCPRDGTELSRGGG